MNEFRIILLKQPQKYLDRLSDKDAEHIRKALVKLKTMDGDITVMHGMKNMFRLRVRDWRVVFEIKDDTIIVVQTIGPRGDVYK